MIVAGPRWQLRPTTSAPACSRRRQASAGVRPSRVTSSRCIAIVITAGTFECLRMASSASSASATQENVSATKKSTPASSAQPTCSAKMRSTSLWEALSAGS